MDTRDLRGDLRFELRDGQLPAHGAQEHRSLGRKAAAFVAQGRAVRERTALAEIQVDAEAGLVLESAARGRASSVPGMFAMIEVLVTTPASMAWQMPAVISGVSPKSSACRIRLHPACRVAVDVVAVRSWSPSNESAAA